MFRFYNKNRSIVKAKVSKLAAAIRLLNMTREKPIVVNEKMEIIDGQHRFEACKRLKFPIYYIKSTLNGKTNDAIITLNANQSAWQLMDYVKNYADRGYADYKLILECMDKYKVTISCAVAFVSNADTSGSSLIKTGRFKKGATSYHTLAGIHVDFGKIFKGADHILFIRALVILVKSGKYNHKEMFSKFVRQRYDLQGCATVEQYLKMFESMLNHRKRGEKIRLV